MALTQVSRGLLSTSIVDNGNATAITIDSSENVGIGVSSPTARLSLPAQASGDSGVARFAIESAVDSNDFTISQYEDGSGTYTLIGQNISLNSGGNVAVLDSAHKTAGVLFDGRGNGQLEFYTGAANASSSKMTIDSSGKVGIGASTVDQKLHLEESGTTPVYLKTQNSAGALLVGNNSEGNSYVSAQTSGKPLLLETENTERMRIAADGTTTIGRAITPTYDNDQGYPLHIQAAAGNQTYLSISVPGAASGNTGLVLGHDATGTRITNREADPMIFGISSTEKMRITSAGAVAIGRTASITAACLELQPPAQISDFSSYILNIGGDEADDAVGTKSGIGFGYTSSSRTAAPATIGYETQATTGGTYGDLYFATRTGDGTGQPTVRMRINSDGHVTAPYNPAFRAYLSTEQTSNGLVSSGWSDSGLAEGRTYDRDGDFNTSTGRFTAPVDGIYLFSVMWDSNASQAGFDLLVNPTNAGNGFHVRWEPTGRTDNSWESRHYSTHIKLDKDDYVMLGIRHASGTHPVHMGGAYWGHFAGCLIS